jgi:hypothetical protein
MRRDEGYLDLGACKTQVRVPQFVFINGHRSIQVHDQLQAGVGAEQPEECQKAAEAECEDEKTGG